MLSCNWCGEKLPPSASPAEEGEHLICETCAARVLQAFQAKYVTIEYRRRSYSMPEAGR